MSTPMLATKLYIPPPRPNLIARPRLFARLNGGMQCKLTLVSAPAGFGKTTLISAWAAHQDQRLGWLALDEGDSDPKRFLAYLVAALQRVAEQMESEPVGRSVLGMIQSPQSPPVEAILTTLLNDVATLPASFALILDDYHLIDAPAVDQLLTFLLEHLPPQMHLIIATREDPLLPLARYRVRGELTEVRATDLRFTAAEAADFLNGMMGLALSTEAIAALESRTEGWIAGLQLAAISMQGHHDSAAFINSFTGSHRFVMDYLVEEVLQQQPAAVQRFLLQTSILDRLCGPLCDAVVEERTAARVGESPMGGAAESDLHPAQATLEQLEQANLFIVPLDNERQWYRYHRLFGDLLRQRLQQSSTTPTDVAELHTRASAWYEANGLLLDAFHHATAANDVARAERLIEGGGMPLHFRPGGVGPVLTWLSSLPTAVLDRHPALWTTYASVALVTGQASAVEEKLQAAEAALQAVTPAAGPDEKLLDLIGRIAAIRSTVAAGQQQIDAIIAHSQRALEFLHPDNLAFRTSTAWKLGYAYHLQGNRVAASKAYGEVIAIGESTGNIIFTSVAVIGLASLQAAENQLVLAAETFRRALDLYGDPPLPDAGVAHLGLARIYYAWNDLPLAQQHVEESMRLAAQNENRDRAVESAIFYAQLELARGNVSGAAAHLRQAATAVREHNLQTPKLVAAQVRLLLWQGDLAAAAELVQAHDLPVSRARVHLARNEAAAALALLVPWRQQMESKEWADEILLCTLLEALAHHAGGDVERALQQLDHALTLAEPSGMIRLFVDEGAAMAGLLQVAAAHQRSPTYVAKVLAAFDLPESDAELTGTVAGSVPQPLVEPLSERELEVLQLVAEGLSNREIGERLYLALDTVKGHNRRIFGKLQVQRRTEAVARARELALL